MTTPLRLAVTSYYLPSESKIGAGWMAHRLANALIDLGHDVTMFSPCRAPSDASYRHHLVELSGSMRTFRWGWAIRRLDLSGFDGLLAQGDDHFVRRSAVPAHIRTLHGSCFDELRYIPRLREKARMFLLGVTELAAAVRTPDVVGVSKTALRFFPWRHRVIPNGVDTGRFHPDPSVPKEQRPTVLFVGTFHRRKRGALLHEVFRTHVLPRVPDAQLWMVCDDAPEAPGIEVLGRLSDEELADRYRRAWVFCLPSSYEGFGVPYVEAMVSGTAVVATPNRGAREVLEDGAAGVLAADDHLGAEIVRLLTDTESRQRFEQAGLARRDRYDIHATAQQYVDLVRSRLV
ncbi:MAG: glycosyltransferase family 4 protein [Acidimicrobiia bacterium]